MAVARRAETYIRAGRAQTVSLRLSRRVNAPRAGRGRSETGRAAGPADVVDGGARASGLGFMRPSYFASCEPVIPGRAGDLWPRCVPPAPLILPFRPESNFHLSSAAFPPSPPTSPGPVASPLPNPRRRTRYFVYVRAGDKRELISSFRHLRARAVTFSPVSPPSTFFLFFYSSRGEVKSIARLVIFYRIFAKHDIHMYNVKVINRFFPPFYFELNLYQNYA